MGVVLRAGDEVLERDEREVFPAGFNPGGLSKRHSQWIADGIHAIDLVHADKSFITGLLDALVKNHEAWKQGTPEGGPWQASRLLDNGLYWRIDSWEGQEVSIGGTGIRPPMNSYRIKALKPQCQVAIAGEPS